LQRYCREIKVNRRKEKAEVFALKGI